MEYGTARETGKGCAVLVPCLDEAKTVAKVVRDFKAALPEAAVWVGDNMSSDGTGDIAAREPGCAGVIRCSAEGKGAAMREMLGRIGADWYIFVDGDATYDAEAAPDLLRLAKRSGGMAVGRRHLSSENQPFLHKPGNALVDLLISLKHRHRVHDSMSGYRAISAEFARDYARHAKYDGFQVEVEITMLALSRKLPILYVPCRYYDRPDGSRSKLHTFRDGARIVWAVLSYRRPET